MAGHPELLDHRLAATMEAKRPQTAQRRADVRQGQGGADQTVLIWRHDAWYSRPVIVSGSETPTGSEAAGLVVRHRRDGADIIVDIGGGFGGSVTQRLKDNRVDPISYNGANRSTKRTKDRKLGFANRRAQSYWSLREALDPDQP